MNTEREKQITNYLNMMQIPDNLNGFKYLKLAVSESLNNPEYLRDVTNVLYNIVGEKYHVSKQNVEISIRRAIEKAWSRSEDAMRTALRPAYGCEMLRKPTNLEIISDLNWIIRLEEISALC